MLVPVLGPVKKVRADGATATGGSEEVTIINYVPPGLVSRSDITIDHTVHSDPTRSFYVDNEGIPLMFSQDFPGNADERHTVEAACNAMLAYAIDQAASEGGGSVASPSAFPA